VQAIDMLWFAKPEDALAWTHSDEAHRAAWHLAGLTFGAERLIARPPLGPPRRSRGRVPLRAPGP